MTLAEDERRRDFAANRAVSRIALAVGAEAGTSARTRLAEAGSLRLRFPRSTAGGLEAMIVNTAGGIAGGDRCGLEIAVGAGASLVVGSSAAEKIYRSLGPEAQIAVTLTLGAGASLAWLPQETILFDHARLSRRIEVAMAPDASLLLAEAVIFGRSAMGEVVSEGSFADRWEVRRDGRLAFVESLRLDGAIAQTLAAAAVARGGVAVATVLAVPGDDTIAARVRALDFLGEVGASAWNGIAIVRFCAADGARLRHDLVAVLAALAAPVPRLWLN